MGACAPLLMIATGCHSVFSLERTALDPSGFASPPFSGFAQFSFIAYTKYTSINIFSSKIMPFFSNVVRVIFVRFFNSPS